MKKILTIVGARPQFIKASAISRAIRDRFSTDFQEIIVHTGQHYDANMSQVFFEQLDIDEPKYNLNVSGLNHGAMTGRMMEALEELMISEKPDLVLVYGDTNSTLAGAVTAAKLHIPIAHVEAGLRSFNRKMPEEINRILTDTVSSFLFCPTDVSVQNLKNEGICHQVFNVGDVMYDVALYFAEKAKLESHILNDLGLSERQYILVTCHREENTNSLERLTSILQALAELSKSKTIIFPIHPRTLKYIQQNDLSSYLENVHVIEPLPYMDLIALQQSAESILTDSGGIQKEAFFYQVPCITMRDETEWVETIDLGWNQLVGANANKIIQAVMNIKMGKLEVYPYGHGKASEMIINILKKGIQQ
jgi:UDP-GlcNAc3NAcA epimerase